MNKSKLDSVERMTDDTPLSIKTWLLFPYQYFSLMFNNKKENILLDIGCGNNIQRPILINNFKEVISMDISANDKDIINGSILNIPLEDKTVDISFSFETIEHVSNHQKVISELKRVTKKIIVIGSVNRLGPDYIENDIIFKNGRNKYHVKELSHLDWKILFKDDFYYHSVYENGHWCMKKNVSKIGISNYAIIKL